jgi:hypothetical protein
MKRRLGTFCLLLGFVELAVIFGWVYMVNNHDWTSPLPGSIMEANTFTFIGAILTIVSPFAFIILGSLFLEAGEYKILHRKRSGLCWACGANIKESGPEFKCPKCGHAHDGRVIQLHLEISERQQRLRELGDG